MYVTFIDAEKIFGKNLILMCDLSFNEVEINGKKKK